MTPESGSEMARLMHDTLLRLRRLPLISVAAIDGFALGGGAELSTTCDFRVVARNASIRFVQMTMGVTPGFGGMQTCSSLQHVTYISTFRLGGTRLTKLIGRSNALRLLLSMPTLHAEEAYALGLCDQIAEDRNVYEESVRLLNTFLYESGGKGSAKHPVNVVRAMKKVVAAADELPFETSLVNEREIFQTLWGGEANLAAMKRISAQKK